ncbi:plasmid partitioning protein [Mesorhizobium sp. M2D.F.Ca.ET.185.01.1.1]|uniref:ParB N-terminal domain-containing protein n=1 Tax=unclassified Mesorhizobium TaxID=325217 RepID=UPI000FCC5B45|nr:MULTISPECIES: ParB N-terminal domain-containing protein [unclassified Mesorhizobium]TGP77290.1 plasmid partitioning protein [bacterium M00.F.Ca.ET.227.01.1.1]TGP93083.1 plasmid partitioning protein [bacterium M00.F.Ca.ET.222.01.1.1]TGP96629.1 plasmid partitioning protein [bacterium M00.F.Ca.ET.221.01.1.1]TGU20740.1 plasmid partitioning protein [bacterium M00.F.Ca.ET.156.01.1.1]TGU49841.1 plasmid partitioning protein [bacterium M00.F.Ca.ET.146.01.1.1]TGV68707.1 plasmid partitioning protein 
MELKFVDPRSLKDNPDKARRSKSSPQADALLLATIKAVGIVQPPVVAAETDGGNGFVIDEGHRRVKQAIAAGLDEIAVLVVPRAEDGGAMRSLVTTIAHEQLNPVDQWRAVERLVALGWTEEAIGIALAQSVRQIKKLRLLANVLPAMLDHMAKGDMPDERQLRTIAAASLDEQKEVWKAHKPSKGDRQVSWWAVANGLAKTRMYARDASFGDDLREAYGIAWVEDLFAPADQDSRYTTNVDAFLGAQQEWMTQNLPKKGVISEANTWGEVKLPPKAERVYGTPKKSDHTAMYLDREGKVKTVHFRMPEAKKAKGKGAEDAGDDEAIVVSKPRPDVTRKGIEMIGDLRTDALHEALSRAPIEDDTLFALLVLAFAGQNVRVDSGPGGDFRFRGRFDRHAASLFDAEGQFAVDIDTLRVAARGVLIDVLSCRENISKSGIVGIVAGRAIGADGFLANMGTEDFLSCLSRPALEASCADTPVLPRARVKDTRAALVDHYKEGHFVHPSALFAPDAVVLSEWLAKSAVTEVEDEDAPDDEGVAGEDQAAEGDATDEFDEGYREAAE